MHINPARSAGVLPTPAGFAGIEVPLLPWSWGFPSKSKRSIQNTDTLCMRIAKSADWRRRLISKFPDDARIIAAAERLERLSHTPEDEIDVEFWAKLKPYLDT